MLLFSSIVKSLYWRCEQVILAIYLDWLSASGHNAVRPCLNFGKFWFGCYVIFVVGRALLFCSGCNGETARGI